MEIVLGLGAAGCKIADCFGQYPQYKVYKIDAGLKKAENSFSLPEGLSHEEYEGSVSKSFTSFAKKIPDGDILFVVSGAGFVSGASLKILEKFKKRKISVLYIKPDSEMSGGERALQERLVYHVFQEYARSGVFEKLLLVHNSTLEKLLGGLSIKNYHQKINETVVSTLHMLNIFRHTEPVLSQTTPSAEISRIITLGVIDCEKNQESFFFPLDNVSEIEYYYGMNEETLETDDKILGKIKETVREKKTSGLTRVGYEVYTTEYDEPIGYCVARTSTIQMFPEKEEEQ